MLVAIGATRESHSNCEVISYEAPFGVGYLVAQLTNAVNSAAVTTGSSDAPARNSAPQVIDDASDVRRAIPALARRTIETFVNTGTVLGPPGDLPDFFKARAACFVSIKTRDGELRGCIGTVEPAKNTLAAEIIYNAAGAATRDPRFSPVSADELANLKYSVDVLSEPEPCTLKDLDPRIYGVIVESESGYPRGLLLPNLQGVDTARQQVDIAARKAGLDPNGNIRLFRFRADRYPE
jgi:AmmeMemoRadiSam system protein A